MRLLVFLTYFLSTLIVLNAQERAKSVFNQSKAFDIQGKIIGYVPGNDNRFITFRTYSLKERSKDTAIGISKDGTFSCRLYQPFEGDFAMMYRGGYENLYAKPGERISMEIDETKWKHEENKSKVISLTGESAAISKYIMDFQFRLHKHAFTSNPNLGDKNLSDDVFAKTVLARMNEELAFLDEYCAVNKIDDTLFHRWCSNDIIYSNGGNIVFFPFLGKLNKDITCTQLVQNLSSIPITNSRALFNSNYYEFLNRLRGGFQIIGNNNLLYSDSIKSYGNSKLLFNLGQIDTYTTGMTKEIMYFYSFNNKNVDCEKNMSLYDRVIIEPYLKQLLAEERNKKNDNFVSFNVAEKVRSHPNGESLSEWIVSFLKRNKDKYIFIDFWGSWCGPCMIEMPHYQQLIASLKGKRIVFLFLAVQTSKEKMQEIKKKYRIDAEFVSLTDNDTQILNNVFGFSSYPHHLMIDPQGNLIKNEIYSISSGNQLDKNAIGQIELAISKKP